MSKAEIQYTDIIIWLKKFCRKKRFGKTYLGLEKSSEFIADVDGARTKEVEFFVDPMLPIDLVAVYSKKEKDQDKPGEKVKVTYYTLFWIVSTEESDAEKLGVKLQFCQFLLSRVTDLRSVKIYLVVHEGVKRDLEVDLLRIAKNDGFGLLKLESVEKPPNELADARSFRYHIEKVLGNPPKDMKLDPLPRSVKKRAKKSANTWTFLFAKLLMLWRDGHQYKLVKGS